MKSALAASIVAREKRDDKLKITPEELQAMHLANAATFGNQPHRIVAETRANTRQQVAGPSAKEAVSWAIRSLSEREAVLERDGFKMRGGIAQKALEYAPGHNTL